ncbi:MAG: succinylglutamate desuccinylase/aspartoacylase family protein [bacterium]|nr:succinylglutamate desuccinylase/aspartoacylase family protein [bacterium]
MKLRLHRMLLVAVVVLAMGSGVCRAKESGPTRQTTTGLIAKDTRWETPFYIIDTGVAGPTVMVTGGFHGNEPAGSRAADQVRHWPIVKGRLIVVPRANVPGLAANTRHIPNVKETQRDLNRDFPVSDEGEITTLGTLATELWGFAGKHSPDWVIDLHEGFEFHSSHKPSNGGKRSVGSTIICKGNEQLNPLLDRALAAANSHVDDSERTFVRIKRSPVAGSFARAAALKLGAKTMILETTFKDQPVSLRTRQHRAMVNSLLGDIGIIDRDCSRQLTPGPKGEAIQVGVFDGAGTGGKGIVTLHRIVDQAAKIDVHQFGADECRPDVLGQFDLVVFPGGSGSKQAAAIGKEGRAAVRDFVRTGGGYIGICAGAYLCSAHYSWSLDMIDSSVFTGSREIEGKGKKQMWYRGDTTRVDLELSEAGKQLFTRVPEKFAVRYHNGPIISPKQDPEIEDYTPLAWFRSEQVRYEPQRGTMVDTPAIVSGQFGKGRLISISPHPESDKALESIIVDSIGWVSEPLVTAP